MPEREAELAGAWWRDEKQLRRAIGVYGDNNAALAGAGGCSENVIRKWRKRHGVAPSAARGSAERRIFTAAPEADDAWLLTLLKKHGDDAPVDVLADAADVAPHIVREALDRLGRDGYRVAEESGRVVLTRIVPENTLITPALFDGKDLKVGVVSDTHLGSNEEALEELHAAYDVFVQEGITEVWHPGDIQCGVEIFGKKQHTEAKVHTLDDARDYTIANYPERPGITTRLIGGNHDLEGAAGKAGFDIARAVAAQRPDIEYLGPFSAYIRVGGENGALVHLLHGKGGMSYAYSYKAQKIVEGYTGGRKPQALVVGHWHVQGSFCPRSVHVLFPGCFEWQSQFMSRLGLSPWVGFHILEIRVADDGSIVEWTPRAKPFYAGRVKVAA